MQTGEVRLLITCILSTRPVVFCFVNDICFIFARSNLKSEVMKRNVTLAAVAMSAMSFASAQESDPTFGFSKGDVFVEGNMGFSSVKETYETTRSFVFAPAAGHFIRKDLALGVRLVFIEEEEKEDIMNTILDKRSAFSVGFFSRYYFLGMGKRLKTFTNVGVAIGSGKTGSPEVKHSSFGAGVGLGMNYFVTERIAINAGLADILAYTSVSPNNGPSKSEFAINLNVFNNFSTQAQFGLTFKF